MADRCPFEVGDKVRRIDCTWAGMNIGDVDEVIKIENNGTSVQLKKYYLNTETMHAAHNLELLNKSKVIDTNKFKIGDKVVLTTNKYGNTVINDPQWGKRYGFVVGQITSINTTSGYPYRIEWNNGRGNYYRANDLSLLKDVKKVRTETNIEEVACLCIDVIYIELNLRSK